MKNTKKSFKKFSDRAKSGKRGKDAARRALLAAVAATGTDISGVRLRFTEDLGPAGRRSDKVMRGESRVEGQFSGARGGFGFLRRESGEDIFIPRDRTAGAIDGDTVEVIYHEYRDHSGNIKTEGRVTRIIEEGRREVVGRIEEEHFRHGRHTYRRYILLPDDARLGGRFWVGELSGARPGDKVIARIRRERDGLHTADVTESFGRAETKEANYAAILAEHGIPTEFTEEELAEAENVTRVPPYGENRVDHTAECVFTIDGEGAKDLDDAVSLVRTPGGGFKLCVHIADVSAYVTERTALDRCATARGNSVYFVDKVVPMLPTALSNGACSLNAGEEKLTLSAVIYLDAEGVIKRVNIHPGLIRSRVRGVYSEVNALLLGTATADIKKKYSAVAPSLKRMEELYRILKRKADRRGYMELEDREAVIILDGDGHPTDIVARERGTAEKMIEQFMLTANEAVARELTARGIPCVYRVHSAPPADKLSELAVFLHNLGFDTSAITREKADAGDFSDLLSAARERGNAEVVSYAILRAMAKAEYSDKHAPHFGLGLEDYCHFTSPIRRLSDLVTHRIIRRVLFDGKRPQLYASQARRAAAAATEAELRTLDAERKIENLYKVIYMEDKLGESFDATVSGVTAFGLFCQLSNTCEGLVPMESLPYGFVYDEKNLSIRSRTVCFRVTDPVRVRLVEADRVTGRLRFELA